MTTLSTTNVTPTRARRALLRHVEHCCARGASNVKVRINTKNDQPDGVWFYGRIANAWKKLPETMEGSEFAGFITVELERLAASPHTEECQVRRKQFLDRVDFEIKFHHDKILAHQGKQLGSYLSGILFCERHEAPDARRQGIRRGMKRLVVRV